MTILLRQKNQQTSSLRQTKHREVEGKKKTYLYAQAA